MTEMMSLTFKNFKTTVTNILYMLRNVEKCENDKAISGRYKHDPQNPLEMKKIQ